MGHFFVSALGCLGGIVLSIVLMLICHFILDTQFGEGISSSDFPNLDAYFAECRRRARSIKLQTMLLAMSMTLIVTAVLAHFFGGDSGVTLFGLVFAMLCSLLLKSV